MSQLVDEIRDQIHDARSDGYTKDELTILVGDRYMRALSQEQMLNLQVDSGETMVGSTQTNFNVDGIPVMTVSWLDDRMMVVGHRSASLSGSSLGSLGLAER